MEKQKFIFDIDGTLLEPDYSYEVEYFKSILSSSEAERFIPMISKYLAAYEATHKRYSLKKLSRYLTARSEILITEYMIKGWKEALGNSEPKLIGGVVDSLEELKKKEKELVILTNWFLEPQMAKLKKAGIADYFTEFYGGEYVLKPNPESYMLARGKHSAEECVMIGDSLVNDVYGAMVLGMDAVYYNPKNNDNFDKKKVKSIGSMSEIGRMY